MKLIIGYICFLILFSIYSYALMDPNITFLNAHVWEVFRNIMVYLGYYQREISSIIYIVGILGLFAFHYAFLKQKTIITPLKLSLIVGGILITSYPFLSHDFFNYMFDARIFTFYHENPYLKRALDFPNDPWVRFMHWTHRTYPYGPTFLLLTLVPSFLSFGKFLLSFFLFKLLFVGCYCFTVWILQQKDKNWAVIFATHPLVILEGLINTHNDLVGIAFAVAGICYIAQKKEIVGRLLLLVSIGIKYLTFPFILASRWKYLNWIVIAGVGIVMIYLSFKAEIQPWYFLTVIALIPYIKEDIHKLTLFMMGLAFSYYPYIRFGGWDKQWKVDMKHEIIWVFSILNVVYLLYFFVKKRFFTR
ncbi:MAG: hypothetical protein ABIO02_03200 [Patescibacteria group bacterium]